MSQEFEEATESSEDAFQASKEAFQAWRVKADKSLVAERAFKKAQGEASVAWASWRAAAELGRYATTKLINLEHGITASQE